MQCWIKLYIDDLINNFIIFLKINKKKKNQKPCQFINKYKADCKNCERVSVNLDNVLTIHHGAWLFDSTGNY
jgi:hypothetical protein